MWAHEDVTVFVLAIRQVNKQLLMHPRRAPTAVSRLTAAHQQCTDARNFDPLSIHNFINTLTRPHIGLDSGSQRLHIERGAFSK